ncbi:succinyl-CoA--3-ketoacid-CoA transferase [Bacillus sp. FJAT-27225]|uniref:CoA transferase subunit B n=1 Tax=Bacillus sp. FJAT-27225 TaxID=1743144 RepID=UPI00080C326C|nr:CoA transferase subunit B [Bacillus sp. FJAT-27225]OCA83264.1 succinyl-CoA--3-ketoacid-CoA transferase [Bacillus sp. FJAT-27225]
MSTSQQTSSKQIIAARVAKEMQNGDVVNLGIGLPTMVPNYLPEDVNVILQSENGYVGLGPLEGDIDPDLVNAGGQPSGILPGGAFFDSLFSFELIRGGHVDVTVLGGLEVDENGNLANWMVPGKMVPGMGGAMDLVTGAKKVIVAMEHVAKNGNPKILKECRLPLTGKGVVDLIVTELAVFRVTDSGLILEELQEGATLEMVEEKTEASFMVSPDLKK